MQTHVYMMLNKTVLKRAEFRCTQTEKLYNGVVEKALNEVGSEQFKDAK